MSVIRQYFPKAKSTSDWLLVMNKRMLPPDEWKALLWHFSESKSPDRDYSNVDAKIIAAVQAAASIVRLSADEDNLDRYIEMTKTKEAA